MNTVTVSSGTVLINGTLDPTTVNVTGATLGGTGTITADVNIGSGATLMPGIPNVVGTLNITGNLVLTSAASYLITINGISSGKTIIGGTATLGGATVNIAAASQITAGRTYTILTATGGRSGTFNPTVTFGSSTGTLSYDANDVFLTFVTLSGRPPPPVTSFCSVAVTRNQCSVGNALQSFPTGNPLLAAVAGQSGPLGTQQALDALSGEIYGSVQTVILDDSRYIREAVLGRLRQASYGAGAESFAALGSGGPMRVAADATLGSSGGFSVSDSALAYADARQPKLYLKAAPPRSFAPITSYNVTFWAQGVGAAETIDSDGNAAGLLRNLGGFFSGVDRTFGNAWRAGLAVGSTNSAVDISARASSAQIETTYLAAYAGTSYGAFSLRLGANLAWATIGTSRSIVFPGFAESAAARFGASEGQLFGELAYPTTFGNLMLEPFGDFAWLHLDTDSFAETGGIAALSGSGGTDNIGYVTLGARAATNYILHDNIVLTPRASLGWQHTFGEVVPTAALDFQSTATSFGVAGLPLARDAALVEAGADVRLTPHAAIGVSYVGQHASSAQDNSAKGNFTWKF